MTSNPCTCVICGLPFEARTSYGLCSACISRDRLREFDRLESAKRFASRAQLPVSLTLVQWLSVLSDFRNLCAYCGQYPNAVIEMVDPLAGLTYHNSVPCCRACHEHKKHGFETAVKRVKVYLEGERTAQLPIEEEVEQSCLYHFA